MAKDCVCDLSMQGDQDVSIPNEIRQSTIESEFRDAASPDERLRLKQYYSISIAYLRRRHAQTNDFEPQLDALSSVLETESAGTTSAPISDEKEERKQGSGRTLLDIIDGAIARPWTILGPLSQQTGEANGEYRFVCIFCFIPRTRTADIRKHLIKDHEFKCVEVAQIFGQNDSRRLRVFGQYSYDEVKSNGWDIKQWKRRPSKGYRPTEGDSFTTPSSKRKNKHRDSDTSPQTDTPDAMGSSPSVKRRQVAAMPALLQTASHTVSLSESSSMPTSGRMTDFEHEPSPFLHATLAEDDRLSLESSAASDGTLIQMGSDLNMQYSTVYQPQDDTNNIHLCSGAPLDETLARLEVPGHIATVLYPSRSEGTTGQNYSDYLNY